MSAGLMGRSIMWTRTDPGDRSESRRLEIEGVSADSTTKPAAGFSRLGCLNMTLMKEDREQETREKEGNKRSRPRDAWWKTVHTCLCDAPFLANHSFD